MGNIFLGYITSNHRAEELKNDPIYSFLIAIPIGYVFYLLFYLLFSILREIIPTWIKHGWNEAKEMVEQSNWHDGL